MEMIGDAESGLLIPKRFRGNAVDLEFQTAFTRQTETFERLADAFDPRRECTDEADSKGSYVLPETERKEDPGIDRLADIVATDIGVDFSKYSLEVVGYHQLWDWRSISGVDFVLDACVFGEQPLITLAEVGCE